MSLWWGDLWVMLKIFGEKEGVAGKLLRVAKNYFPKKASKTFFTRLPV
jgi:hypothetical protein